MELLTNSVITEKDFLQRDAPPLIGGLRNCAPGWHEFEVKMDPVSVDDDSYLIMDLGDRKESVPMRSRRSLLVYSPRPFHLTYSPPRPRRCSSYTVYALNLLSFDHKELARRFENSVFGDRDKVTALLQLERDEDRWQALKEFIATDLFYCSYWGIWVERPRDVSWEGDGIIRSHSYEPRFLVHDEDRSTRTTMVRCEISGNSISALLLPRIFVSDTDGNFTEQMGIRFPPMIEHRESERLIHVPHVARLKICPASCPGTIRITELRFDSSTFGILLARIFTSTIGGGYREVPTIVRELLQFRSGHGQATGRRGITSKFWLLYRRLSRALSSRELPGTSLTQDLSTWLHDFQPSPAVLKSYCAESERLGLNTRFSVICTQNRARNFSFNELIRSLIEQTYSQWELLLVDDMPAATPASSLNSDKDPRIRYLGKQQHPSIAASSNVALRQASGDYVIFVDPCVVLEKHALFKCAMAVRSEGADIFYSDEYTIGEVDDKILDVTTRPSFSIDHYLSHPYFGHMVGTRRDLAERAGLFDESLQFGQDIDFNLRCLELANVVTHIPDYLCRSRQHGASAVDSEDVQDMASIVSVIEQHLARTGRQATVRTTRNRMVFDVRDRFPEDARVAAIIPTKNNHQLLKKAVDSCIQKAGDVKVEIFIIDHDSDDEATRRYLGELKEQSIATILPYQGPFNFSAMNNMAVSKLSPDIAYYLFLNNDVEAHSDGWVESMAANCSRPDVGVCGAMLLYPDNNIQHGGVTIGLLGAAEHSYKSENYYDSAQNPSLGHACAFVTRRDSMAVTAAAMMVRADVFQEIGGYDERLHVGFNDTDLCLRIFEHGYKVIFDANIVLYHFESATRGTGATDPHPTDTQRFRNKHRIWIEKKDLFYGAHLAMAATTRDFDTNARSQFSRPRTIIQPNGCYGARFAKL